MSDQRRGGRLGLVVGVTVGQARHGLGGTLLDRRHGLAHRVRSIVNRAMVGGHGEGGGSSMNELQVRQRAGLGLRGRLRCGPAPVTRWPPHLPTQGNRIRS